MVTIGCKIDEVRIDGSMEKLVSDLEKMQDFGIKAVELPAHGLDLIFNGKLNLRRLDETLNILKKYSFEYSIHSPNPLNLMDIKQNELHREVFTATLSFARSIRAKAVVYHAGRFVPEEDFNLKETPFFTDMEKREMIETEAISLCELADKFPDVNIAVENPRPYTSRSPYTYAENLEELKKQIEKIDRSNVGINLDFGHLYMTSMFYRYNILDAVRELKNLIIHTHIHDNFGGSVHHWEKQQTHQLPFGKGDSHMPVGWGLVPIKNILEIMLPNYKGLLMMELRSRYFKNIKESKQNLEEIVNSVMGNK